LSFVQTHYSIHVFLAARIPFAPNAAIVLAITGNLTRQTSAGTFSDI